MLSDRVIEHGSRRHDPLRRQIAETLLSFGSYTADRNVVRSMLPEGQYVTRRGGANGRMQTRNETALVLKWTLRNFERKGWIKRQGHLIHILKPMAIKRYASGV